MIASVSVGVYEGTPVLDLDYPEDSSAETDMNVVMNEAGAFIEVQEGASLTQDEVIEHCREHLARYKCPKHVVITELPKTSTGKDGKNSLSHDR